MKMSRQDFEACTPFEFSQMVKAYQRQRENDHRQSWEQTRMLAMCLIQPYAKDRLSPADVMCFPWDANEAKTDVTTPDGQLTAAELKERYKAAAKAAGLN